MIKSLGIPSKDLLRKNEPIYKELGLSRKELSESEIISLIVEHPELLQRPIGVKEEKVILARPAGEIENIL